MLFSNKPLFTAKEIYKISCTNNGKLLELASLSKSRRKKREENNMHLTDGMIYSEPNGFPILKPYNGTVDLSFQPFTKHRKLEGKGVALHFFMDDYKFSTACNSNLERTTFSLSKFDCLLTPDYSLYVDMPKEMNRHNIFLSRFAGAFWQNCGFDVIPTASWSDVDSFDYCFEGLPSNSVIGVCGTGVKWCHASYQLWQYGMRTMEERISPTNIIVYGSDLEVPGLHTPIKFIQDNITKHHRNEADR